MRFVMPLRAFRFLLLKYIFLTFISVNRSVMNSDGNFRLCRSNCRIWFYGYAALFALMEKLRRHKVREKIERLRSAFDEAGIDGILLTNEHIVVDITSQEQQALFLFQKTLNLLQISVTSSRQVNKRLDMRLYSTQDRSLMKWQSK